MFWKTLGIIWTVLLLVGVALLWQSQRLRTGSGAAEAVEQEESPRGTQATALLGRVPPKIVPVARGLICLDAVRDKVLERAKAAKWPKKLQEGIARNRRQHFSARPWGGEGTSMVAIDVRGCASTAEAVKLAEAVAKAFIEALDMDTVPHLDERIRTLEKTRGGLRSSLASLRREISALRLPELAAQRQQELSHRIRLLGELEIRASLKRDRCRGRLIVAQVAAEAAKPAPATTPTDRTQDKTAEAASIRALKLELAEATSELAKLEEMLREARLMQSDLARKQTIVGRLEKSAADYDESLRMVNRTLLEQKVHRREYKPIPELISVLPVR